MGSRAEWDQVEPIITLMWKLGVVNANFFWMMRLKYANYIAYSTGEVS